MALTEKYTLYKVDPIQNSLRVTIVIVRNLQEVLLVLVHLLVHTHRFP